MLSQLKRVQAFSECSQQVTSLDELDLIMREVVSDFSADYYLMIHHADFRQPTPGLVKVGTYPEEFIAISRAGSELVGDAILQACEKTITGFFWKDVGKMVPLTRRHKERAEAVARTGLGDGFVVPANRPGDHMGSCHFAVSRGKKMRRDTSAALQTIGVFGFEAARRLSRTRDGALVEHQLLSRRQLECLVLSARGKSDAVIAQLLGLSHKTVNAYMEAAKRRYGVATRQQLMACALYTSQLSYAEIMEPQRRTIYVGAGSSASNTSLPVARSPA